MMDEDDRAGLLDDMESFTKRDFWARSPDPSSSTLDGRARLTLTSL